MDNVKVGLACDHAGYEMKQKIKAHLEQQGFKVIDYGTNSEESVDYPDFAHPLAIAVEKQDVAVGVSLCGSGNGINMTVNKHQQIRAALCWTEEISKLARQHNNANICSLPARFISLDLAIKIVDIFLNTGFDGGRHQKRIEKIPVRG